MSKHLIISFLIFILACQGIEQSSGTAAYEAFVAKVESIIVSGQVNISDPVVIGVNGKFDDDCSELARISNEKSDSPYNIELTVYGKRKLNAKCNKKDIIYSGSITITGLSVGRYRIRINNDDSLIKYFSVVQGQSEDVGVYVDVGSSCVEEVAPVSTADITTDGFNSAKNQKIPYGTPINLVVKGSIQSECRSFKGFSYSKLGFFLYVNVLAEYCSDICLENNRDYNETYVINGLGVGKYTLFVNSSIEIPFEVVK